MRVRSVRLTERRIVPEREDCVVEGVRAEPGKESREGA